MHFEYLRPDLQASHMLVLFWIHLLDLVAKGMVKVTTLQSVNGSCTVTLHEKTTGTYKLNFFGIFRNKICKFLNACFTIKKVVTGRNYGSIVISRVQKCLFCNSTSKETIDTSVSLLTNFFSGFHLCPCLRKNIEAGFTCFMEKLMVQVLYWWRNEFIIAFNDILISSLMYSTPH